MAIYGFFYSLPDSPIILANNLVGNGTTITASSSAPGFPVAALKNPLTYERWMPNSPSGGSFEISLPNAPIDTIAFAAHSIGTTGALVKIEGYNGVWELLFDYGDLPVAPDDSPYAIALPVASVGGSGYTKLRISIDKQAEIGVVYAGKRLEMPSSIYGGHTPDTIGRETDIKTARSVSGNFLGRTVVRRGYEARYEFKHLGAAWYRSNFEPFAKDAITNPFIIAWYPSKYPDEVIYGWVEQDIVGRNMGVRDFMETSFTVKAIGDGQ
jgi:hypothetical protein